MFKATISQFAEKNGVDYATASHITKFLVSAGQAKETEEKVKKNEKARGRASSVYEYPESVTLKFAA